ncbi:LacI family DNA-binding transcriptional regulator [Cellulomonas sp. APG4]|uniref:LacI family DNA-binding transcriptional regulator n=1 Tax=Cellulomonas sp. APG4 TaxID=1538656 RepID=UPI00351B51EE
MLRRPVRMLGIEAFYTDFMAGVEDVLMEDDRELMLQVVPDMERELDAYVRWSEGDQVGAVIIVDVLVDSDPRLALVNDLGLAALVVAHPDDAGMHSCLVTDEAALVDTIVDELLGLGHRVLARVSGPLALAHTSRRTAAFEAAVRTHGGQPMVVEADFTAKEAQRAVTRLLDGDQPPTAMVFDNDVMAVAALEVISSRGLRVPDDVSLVAGDDSVACRVASPPLSAMSRDVHELGMQAGRAVVDVLSGAPVRTYAAPRPTFAARASTGPVRLA